MFPSFLVLFSERSMSNLRRKKRRLLRCFQEDKTSADDCQRGLRESASSLARDVRRLGWNVRRNEQLRVSSGAVNRNENQNGGSAAVCGSPIADQKAADLVIDMSDTEDEMEVGSDEEEEPDVYRESSPVQQLEVLAIAEQQKDGRALQNFRQTDEDDTWFLQLQSADVQKLAEITRNFVRKTHGDEVWQQLQKASRALCSNPDNITDTALPILSGWCTVANTACNDVLLLISGRTFLFTARGYIHMLS